MLPAVPDGELPGEHGENDLEDQAAAAAMKAREILGLDGNQKKEEKEQKEGSLSDKEAGSEVESGDCSGVCGCGGGGGRVDGIFCCVEGEGGDLEGDLEGGGRAASVAGVGGLFGLGRGFVDGLRFGSFVKGGGGVMIDASLSDSKRVDIGIEFHRSRESCNQRA